VNVAVSPGATLWFEGCVLIAGAVDALGGASALVVALTFPLLPPPPHAASHAEASNATNAAELDRTKSGYAKAARISDVVPVNQVNDDEREQVPGA